MTNKDKKNIQNVMAYLIEINLLSQLVIANRLRIKTESDNYVVESCENGIKRMNQFWNKITFDVSMTTTREETEKLLEDIYITKNQISEDIFIINNYLIDNANSDIQKIGECFTAQKERLNQLEKYVRF